MTRLRKMNSIDHYSYLPPYSFTSCPTYPEIQTPIDLPIFPSPMSISAHPLACTLVRDALLLHDARTPAVSTLICVARLSAHAPAHSPRPQKSPARSPMTNCLSPPFACPPAHPPCPPKSELSTRPHDGCVVFCLCFFHVSGFVCRYPPPHARRAHAICVARLSACPHSCAPPTPTDLSARPRTRAHLSGPPTPLRHAPTHVSTSPARYTHAHLSARVRTPTCLRTLMPVHILMVRPSFGKLSHNY